MENIIHITCQTCKDIECPYCGKDQEANWSCYSTKGECRREIDSNVQDMNLDIFMHLMKEFLEKNEKN